MEQTLTGDAVRAVAELAQRGKTSVEFKSLPAVAVPPGLSVSVPHVAVITDGTGKVEIRSLKPHVDELRGKPVQRTGTARVTTLDSFIDLVNRHANADSAIFVDATWTAPKLTAVIDYHQRAMLEAAEPPPEVEASEVLRPSLGAGDDPLARFGKHRIEYAFPLSEAWKHWVKFHGKAMEQGDFAAFIEDRIHEVSSPDVMEANDWERLFKTRIANPNELLDLSRGLEVSVGATVKQRKRLESGETQFVYETEHRDAQGNTLTVPGAFVIAVPIFYRGEIARIPARLRYRAGSDGIRWFYELYRPDEAVDERVREDVRTAGEKTRLPSYDGAPESA